MKVQAACLVLEHPHERLSDDPPLGLRLDQPLKGLKEPVGCVDEVEVLS